MIISKLEGILKNNKIENEILNQINDFLNNSDKKTLNINYSIDFLEVQRKNKLELSLFYRNILELSNLELKNKLIYLLCLIGDVSFLQTISFNINFFSENTIKEFTKYNISSKLILKWCLYELIDSEYQNIDIFINYASNLLNNKSINFEFENNFLDEKSSVLVNAFLIGENKIKIDTDNTLKKYLVTSSKDIFYNITYSNDDDDKIFSRYLVQKYIESGEQHTLQFVIDFKDKIDITQIDHNWLRFILIISKLSKYKFEESNRIIKLLLNIDHNLVLNIYSQILEIFNDNLEITKNIEKFYDHLQIFSISIESFLSWLSSFLPPTELLIVVNHLKKSTTWNNALINLAANLSDEKGALYLKALLLHENINELENVIINCIQQVLNDDNVPTKLTEIYISYLKGNIEFENISSYISELEFYPFNLFYDKLEIIKSIILIKDNSLLFRRILILFTFANKTHLISELLDLNIINSTVNEIETNIEYWLSLGVKFTSLIQFILQNAVENEEWEKYLDNILDKYDIISSLHLLSDELKLFLLFKLFDKNPKLYFHLLIKNLAEDEFINESIIEKLSSNRELQDNLHPLLYMQNKIYRKSAVLILGCWGDKTSLRLLNNALCFETDEEIIDIIHRFLQN